MAPKLSHKFRAQAAFAFPDALAVCACLLLLLLLQLPARGNAKAKSRLSVCFANFQQLTLGWQMYSEDFNGRLVPNPDLGSAGKISSRPSWAGGWLDFSINADNTNTELLVSYGSKAGPYGGLMGPYVKKNPAIFRCPEDQSTMVVFGKTLPRCRSVSMNSYMAGYWAGGSNSFVSSAFHLFKKSSDIFSPRPSLALVFIDVREDTINDPTYKFDLPKDLDSSNNLTPANFTMVDYPADWHEQGAVLSFADGHVEHWKWRDRRTLPAHTPNTLIPLNVASPGNPDVGRMARSISAPN